MSEYQYYEFQALDKPLSREAQEDIRRLSSRVKLTATSASFVYHYSDFRGNPYQLVADYFDAMLYITNWGSRQVMFRFPAGTIPDDVMENFSYMGTMEWTTEDEYIVLNIEFHDEGGGDGWGWIEGEGLLSGIIPVRDDILNGDYRALYLAWLFIAEYELGMMDEDEDLTEPPMPPNLQQSSPALGDFIAFFGINEDLIASASVASPKVNAQDKSLDDYLDRLSDAEKQAFLLRVLHGESHMDVALAKRLREFDDTKKSDESTTQKRRTLRQIIADSQGLAQQRLAEEKRQAEIIHAKRMENIAQQEAKLWTDVKHLISEKQAKTYDEAVNILKDLHELAKHQERLEQFRNRIIEIKNEYPTLRSFQDRLKRAGLV